MTPTINQKHMSLNKAVISLVAVMCTLQISAQEWRVITKVNRHLSVVAVDGTGDKSGEVLYGMNYDKVQKVPLIYYDYEITNDMVFFYGLVPGEPEKMKVGAVNMKGETVIPFEYSGIEDNDNGTYLLVKDEKQGICSDEGKIIVPVEYGSIEIHGELFVAKRGDSAALYNLEGTLLEPFGPNEFAFVEEFDELYAVKENGKYILRLDEYTHILRDYNQVTPTLFAKTGEVSIRDYFAFLADQREMSMLRDSDGKVVDPSILLPDTNFVEKKLLPVYRNFLTQFAIDNGSLFINHELKKSGHEKYPIRIPMAGSKDMEYLLDFPVTGITREQANLYTQWLTTVYNEYYIDDYYGFFVNCRLPTEKEWTTVAEAGLSEEMRVNHVLDSVNKEGCMLFIHDGISNCKTYDEYLEKSRGGGSVPIISMNADWNGVFQMFGNVSEMTSEPGINKGGSYMHNAMNANTGVVQKGEGPDLWLGFRVVAEVML